MSAPNSEFPVSTLPRVQTGNSEFGAGTGGFVLTVFFSEFATSRDEDSIILYNMNPRLSLTVPSNKIHIFIKIRYF